jgi:hypothetical protein
LKSCRFKWIVFVCGCVVDDGRATALPKARRRTLSPSSGGCAAQKSRSHADWNVSTASSDSSTFCAARAVRQRTTTAVVSASNAASPADWCWSGAASSPLFWLLCVMIVCVRPQKNAGGAACIIADARVQNQTEVVI